MNNVPPPPPPPQPPYLPPPPGQYPPGNYPSYPGYPGQPPPRKGGGGKCFLIGCLVLPVLFVVVGVGLAFIVLGAIKSSDPYKEGVARARANPQVVRAMGNPINEPFFVTGQINLRNSDGEANLHATLSGPKDDGELTVVGNKSDGEWHYSTMRVRVKGTGENIDLLDNSR